jgi:preprotein translocase subunit SecA
MIHAEIERLVERFTPPEPDIEWDVEAFRHAVDAILPAPPDFGPAYVAREVPEITGSLQAWAEQVYDEKEAELGADAMRFLERAVMLHVIDQLWTEYLTEMEDLRQGVGLVAYGQRDPLVQYKNDAYNLFEALKKNIEHDIVHTVYKVTLVQQVAPQPIAQEVQTNRAPDAEPVRTGRPARVGHTARAGQAARPRAAAKVGRNDPCPCGSGKKYKHCHGA